MLRHSPAQVLAPAAHICCAFDALDREAIRQLEPPREDRHIPEAGLFATPTGSIEQTGIRRSLSCEFAGRMCLILASSHG